jgi:3-hydroxyisobutyrate dehydrogenase-like beta-hydroxyacid dehydrogenase
VAGEILGGARSGTTLIEMSTISVEASARVGERAAEADVDYLRSPVSGNPVAVRGGTLTIVVSGPETVARRVDELLRAIGPKVIYVGDGERARVVKLALQVLVGGTAELLGEALVLGESAGVDRARLLEAIGASAVGSPFVAYKTEPLLRDDYSATFTTAMMLKDIDLVLELAEESRLVLPFTRHLRPLLEHAADNGYADADFMALYAQLRQAVQSRPTE